MSKTISNLFQTMRDDIINHKSMVLAGFLITIGLIVAATIFVWALSALATVIDIPPTVILAGLIIGFVLGEWIRNAWDRTS